MDRQREDCERLARDRGWSITEVYEDNDFSASKRTVKRPAYDRMCQDFRDGRFDALICWDLDRLTRQPRQLEDWIEAAEERGLVVVTANGEADLSTDGGRLFARIKASVARAEVERRGARVSAARAQAAQQGRWQGGIRPFGFEPDGMTLRPSEAAEIRKATDSILAGGSLRGIVLDLNGRGVLTSTGRTWHSRTLKQMLTRPRNSGQLVYRDVVTGKAPWPEIVTPDERLRVEQIVSDPSRRTSTGNQVRWLGSGLFRCGVCGSQRIVCNTSGGSRPGQHRPPAYRCGARELDKRSNHLVRHQPAVDELVTETVIARLARDDARALITTTDTEVDTAGVSAEIEAIRARRAALAEMAADGLMSPAECKTALERIRQRTEELEGLLLTVPTFNPLAALIGLEDVRAGWESLDLGRKRSVIDALMVVTLLPSRNRGPRFDVQSVQIEWRQ